MQVRIRLALTVVPALMLAGCARHTQSSAAAPVPAPTAFERQIHNARDAGDGDYQLRTLRQKVAADPDSIPARIELAKAYRERGYPDVALELCRAAAARFPQSGEVELALVAALRESHLRQEAITSLGGFRAAHPDAGAAYFSWMGILLDETGQFLAAEPAHRKALEQAPSQDVLHNNLGYNLLMQKRFTDAAGEFKEALRLNPGSTVARNNLGLALAENNSSAQAVASWQSASDPASAHNNLAAVLIEKGNYSEARKELQIALGYDRGHSAALKNLALVSRLDGEAATMPAHQTKTAWQSWKTGLIRLFVGPLDEQKAGADKIATAQK